MFRFRPRVFPLNVPGEARAPGPVELCRAFARRPGSVVLDSAGGIPRRFNLWGFDPLRVDLRLDSLPALGALLALLRPEVGDPIPGPFHGGFLGALAYDLGVSGEPDLRIPPEPWGFPPIVGGVFTDFVVRSEEHDRAWLVLGEEPGDGRPPLEDRRRRVLEELSRASEPPSAAATGPFRRCTPPEEHRARVELVRDHIRRGEVYQANLAHRFVGDVRGDPLALYERLRAVNRAPFQGYVRWSRDGADGAVLSASPELLLEYDGRIARTRPIKGTAPRGRTQAEDRVLAERLLSSGKDLAELAMIVDLERNDLGRVARVGSVRVEGFPRLETYPSVHHLVADVVAEPRPGVGGLELLAALFPGGSITGAPKVRSMEVLAELEGEGRSFFCGSLGFLDTRGHAMFNVLIRTALWRARPDRGAEDGEVSFRVGGGITWASDPASEDRETLVKAAGLLHALAGPEAVESTLTERGSTPYVALEGAAEQSHASAGAPDLRNLYQGGAGTPASGPC